MLHIIKHFRKLGLTAILLTLTGGCTVLPTGKTDQSDALAKKAKDLHGELAPQPVADPARLVHLSPSAPLPEQKPDFWQRLAAIEDQRKTLDLRVRQLEAVLDEKNQALTHATREVVEANREIAATRAEVDRWKKEMVKLRERLRGSEKDSLVTMQSIVTLMEQMIEGKNKPAAPEGSSDTNGPKLMPRGAKVKEEE